MEQMMNFAWPVTTILYEDYQFLDELMRRNASAFSGKSLIIFGAGIRGSIFAMILEKLGYREFTFVDNNKQKWGGCINSHRIESPEGLKPQKDGAVIIISVEDCSEIRRQLNADGWVEDKNFFAIQTNEYDDYVSAFERRGSIEYLVLGDCGLSQISLQDNQTDSLRVMIERELGKAKTKVLAMHGMGMRSYYNVLKWQLDIGIAKPSVLAIMVNFEVFTGRHHILPRTQHAPLFKKISECHAGNEDMLAYAALTESRSKELITDVSSASSAADSKDNNAKLVLRMNYMYRLRENSEDMEYMFRLFALAKSASAHVIPFIPPVNYMYADKICGEDFSIRYRCNLDMMKKCIKEKANLDVLDLSFVLPDTSFADVTTIDETANYAGRETVCRYLVESIREKQTH